LGRLHIGASFFNWKPQPHVQVMERSIGRLKERKGKITLPPRRPRNIKQGGEEGRTRSGAVDKINQRLERRIRKVKIRGRKSHDGALRRWYRLNGETVFLTGEVSLTWVRGAARIIDEKDFGGGREGARQRGREKDMAGKWTGKVFVSELSIQHNPGSDSASKIKLRSRWITPLKECDRVLMWSELEGRMQRNCSSLHGPA